MKIVFKQSFVKDLKRLGNKTILQRIQTAIEEMETAVSLDEIRHLRKSEGGEFYYRIRLGDYRLGLRVEGETITLVRFLHRKDIHRYFP